ncbi:MAG: radical SAM-associated putative lipoprotein [Candidatus Aegiribacteria sp.]|nr:radical SAM-associated putative lipoprotein [Candidatus Aegiribacteria sp.]
MAEAVRNGRTAILRLSGKLFAAVLSIMGVLSCSGNPKAIPAYGPPSAGLYIWGKTISASGSTGIEGIEVKLTSTDSLYDYGAYTTDSHGSYNLNMGAEYYPWPDSVRLVASDIDGRQNGSFLSRDTLLSLDSLENSYDFIYLEDLNLYLEDAEE